VRLKPFGGPARTKNSPLGVPTYGAHCLLRVHSGAHRKPYRRSDDSAGKSCVTGPSKSEVGNRRSEIGTRAQAFPHFAGRRPFPRGERGPSDAESSARTPNCQGANSPLSLYTQVVEMSIVVIYYLFHNRARERAGGVRVARRSGCDAGSRTLGTRYSVLGTGYAAGHRGTRRGPSIARSSPSRHCRRPDGSQPLYRCVMPRRRAPQSGGTEYNARYEQPIQNS